MLEGPKLEGDPFERDRPISKKSENKIVLGDRGYLMLHLNPLDPTMQCKHFLLSIKKLTYNCLSAF